MRTAFTALSMLGGVTCFDKMDDDTAQEVGNGEEPPATGGDTDTAPPPSGDATLRVTNLSGYDIYYVWQCDYSEEYCYDALGSGILPDGDELEMSLEAGAWWTIAVDELDYCATSGLYELVDGDEYYWKITDIPGVWDDYAGTCYE
jgi:hypothetical protein